MVSKDNLYNQPPLKKNVVLSLIFISDPPLMVFLVLLPCNFSNGIFFKEMLSALIDNNLLSVATLIHSLSINCLIPEQ